MSASNEQINEFSILLKETTEEVVDNYYVKICDALQELGVFEGFLPRFLRPEVWTRLAQALADTSGYRVILQAAALKESM